mmetsp:Transcript_2898/g.4186  ORF Transcript_2898/g.4186 Transcript_2898/m.4186 type:complete len:313 (+) Transcript_2898:735-1673(+)
MFRFLFKRRHSKTVSNDDNLKSASEQMPAVNRLVKTPLFEDHHLLTSMIIHHADGLEFAVNLFYMACSFRYRKIKQYPTFLEEQDNPKLTVLKILDSLPRLEFLKRYLKRRKVIGHSRSCKELLLAQLLMDIHPSLYDLMVWIIKRHEPWTISLENKKLTDELFHYTLKHDDSHKFELLKKNHGSKLGWHGSPHYCWHPIVIEGLKNMSNTPFELHGHVMGEGINLSKYSSMAHAYVSYTPCWKNSEWSTCCVNGFSVGIMALCEFISLPSYEREKAYVIPKEEHVRVVSCCIFSSNQLHAPRKASSMKLCT